MIPFSYDFMQPMYPLLIQQFLDDYNLSAGVALDIGTGPGNLAVELAKVTAMDLILVDIDGEALRTAQSRLFELGVDNRISTLCADVEKLPLRDNLADFIMCRGSIGFWPVPVQGITEIYRVLKPGGCAIVGVGAGRYMPETMRRRIYESMSASDRTTSPRQYTLEDYDAFARQAMLSDYRVIIEDDISKGCWLEVKNRKLHRFRSTARHRWSFLFFLRDRRGCIKYPRLCSSG